MNAIAIANSNHISEIQLPDKSFLIKFRLEDGTSQLIEINEEQAASLGIHISNTFETNESSENVEETDENTFEPSDDYEEVENGTLSFVYRIVRPEELNLKHTNQVHLPRGRPKKRICVTKSEDKEIQQPLKVVKSSRTRSGRITRPPKYIEQDFKKIDLQDDSFEGDLKTKEFEPLRTNENPIDKSEEIVPLLQLNSHRRKRIISSQYRCPTCKKAYLGRMRIFKHLQKYPDHGNMPENLRQEHTTWKFLIDTALKATTGSKAKTFYEELTALIQNARTLAKYLFKVSESENSVKVDSTMAAVLGIPAGQYTCNENDLCKDVSLFSYLDMNYFDETYLNHSNDMKVQTETLEINTKSTNNEVPSKQAETKTETSTEQNNYTSNNVVVAENTPSTKFPEGNNHSASTVQEKLYVYPDKQSKNQQKQTEKFEIHNQLLGEDVEELILSGVDSGQNILDNSTNSDDIMNVDQFVNERFKKLTESDIEMPNPLNMDLPALDLFQFHST